jgi:hypothetical protein
MEDSTGTERRRVLLGFRTVAEALKEEDFPMDKSGLYYAVGDIKVEAGGGELIETRLLIDRIPQETFRTAEEVMRALHEYAVQARRPAA